MVDTDGKTVAPGATGEIVIRGPSVMKEYENNPTANADAFYDGWFRTGDQGVTGWGGRTPHWSTSSLSVMPVVYTSPAG